MKKYIILMDTLLAGKQSAYLDENERAVIYHTRKQAEEVLLDDYLWILKQQIEEYKNGQREFDEIDISCNEWIEECDVDEDGAAILEDGTIISHNS